MIFSSSTSSTIPYSRCKKTPDLKIYRSSRQLIKTSDCPVSILYRLLYHVLLLYKIPAKYRLAPMPPPPCCAWSPAPPGADFGTVQSYYAVLQAGRRACVPYGFGMKQSTIFLGTRDEARCAKADGLPDFSRRGRCAQIRERRDL